MVFHGGLVGGQLHRLEIFGNGHVGDTAIPQRGAAGAIRHDQGMCGTSDLDVVSRHGFHQLYGVHTLQKTRSNQVVKSAPGSRQHRGAIVVGIV
jgi:hypothetical protein